jgi:hypothetical protein
MPGDRLWCVLRAKRFRFDLTVTCWLIHSHLQGIRRGRSKKETESFHMGTSPQAPGIYALPLTVAKSRVVLPPGPVSPELALRSLPSVAVSSTQVGPVYLRRRGRLPGDAETH